MVSRSQRSYISIFTTARTRPPSRRASSSPRFAPDSRRAERAGRLLECLLERAWGCGERPELWRVTLSVLKHRCPGFCASQAGTETAQQRDSPGDSTASAAGTTSPAPCDKSKARELMAVWRSYNNL
ncbi:uncharacterized protein LOC131573030 isoform X2 [Poecile atricapillus]|uniref:uncharacterized protein LOC131573030 isoform X2 n=1 Tax=Poecile atricapillus TaxID=48891 RepID=UPI002739DEF6|nr:uncharacterized protein LOC131573030 isoform X2 [Poecile atricapillus]